MRKILNTLTFWWSPVILHTKTHRVWSCTPMRHQATLVFMHGVIKIIIANYSSSRDYTAYIWLYQQVHSGLSNTSTTPVQLAERLSPIGIIEAWLRAHFKTLPTSRHHDTEGFKGRPSIRAPLYRETLASLTPCTKIPSRSSGIDGATLRQITSANLAKCLL